MDTDPQKVKFNPRKFVRNTLTILGLTLMALSFLSVVLLAGAWIATPFQIADYEDQVGGHVDAAIAARSPEDIILHLQEARLGSYRLGIYDESYAAPYSWKQHYGCSAEYTFDYWETVIDRAEETIQWRQEHSGKATDFDASGDRYHEKVKDLHSMVQSSVYCGSAASFLYSDGNIYNSYLASEHEFIFFMRYWVWVWVLSFVASAVALCIMLDSNWLYRWCNGYL